MENNSEYWRRAGCGTISLLETVLHQLFCFLNRLRLLLRLVQLFLGSNRCWSAMFCWRWCAHSSSWNPLRKMACNDHQAELQRMFCYFAILIHCRIHQSIFLIIQSHLSACSGDCFVDLLTNIWRSWQVFNLAKLLKVICNHGSPKAFEKYSCMCFIKLNYFSFFVVWENDLMTDFVWKWGRQ